MIAETQYYLVISSSSHLDWAFNVVKCVVDCFMQKNNKTVENNKTVLFLLKENQADEFWQMTWKNEFFETCFQVYWWY